MNAKVGSFCWFMFAASFLVSQGNFSTLDKKILDFIYNSCLCKCGIPNREARLVGGEYLTGHEFPWAASLQVQGSNDSRPATLITPRYLLTSANNVVGKTPLDVKVILGQLDKCSPDVTSMSLSVDRILIHSDYDPGTRAHDIALIRLSAPVRTDKRILPICLPSTNFNYAGQVGTVFSSTPTVNSTSCKAKKLGLPILKKADCIQGLNNSDYLTKDKGCIGVLGTTTPLCKDDSGAPVMYKSHSGIYDLVGILGDKNDCEGQSVALYTDVNEHFKWIVDNTVDSCFCKRMSFSLPPLQKKVYHKS